MKMCDPSVNPNDPPNCANCSMCHICPLAFPGCNIGYKKITSISIVDSKYMIRHVIKVTRVKLECVAITIDH